MKGIRRARVEFEVFVETSCFVVLGVNENGTDAGDVGGL